MLCPFVSVCKKHAGQGAPEDRTVINQSFTGVCGMEKEMEVAEGKGNLVQCPASGLHMRNMLDLKMRRGRSIASQNRGHLGEYKKL